MSNVSFLNLSERAVYATYTEPVRLYKAYGQDSAIARLTASIISEVGGRLAGLFLLSSAAALDLTFHALLILPTVIYAAAHSLYCCKMDFILPWQHLQRVQDAVAPLLLGSLLGLIHPYAGLAISEPTAKHIACGILPLENSNGQSLRDCFQIKLMCYSSLFNRLEDANGKKELSIFIN